MTNQRTRLLLFLSSYAPLFLILAVRSWDQNRWVSVGLASLTVLSLTGLQRFLSTAMGLEPGVEQVSGATSLAGDSMSYMFTYILPFLDFDFGNMSHLFTFLVFFGVIAVIYVRSNMIYVNPVLNVLGYHVFKIETEYGKEVALITGRSHVPIGRPLTAARLGDYVLFEEKQ